MTYIMPDEYRRQRYDRLCESLDEYLCCDGDGAGYQPLLEDLHKALTELAKFPEYQLKNIHALQDRLFK